jgi:hypothetical protein
MTEHEPPVISDIDELIKKSKEPGDVELFAGYPDREEILAEAETPVAVSSTEKYTSEEKPLAEMSIDEQIASVDSNTVATVRDEASFDRYLRFLEGHESNPNLPSPQPLKRVGEIFTNHLVPQRLAPRRLVNVFASGD